jgi:hypothetical protein
MTLPSQTPPLLMPLQLLLLPALQAVPYVKIGWYVAIKHLILDSS